MSSSKAFASDLVHRPSTLWLPGATPPLRGDRRYCALYKRHLTSHEEEKSGDILHQIMFLAAAQHAYDPAEQDDRYGHAYETGGHPFQVCKHNTGGGGYLTKGP